MQRIFIRNHYSESNRQLFRTQSPDTTSWILVRMTPIKPHCTHDETWYRTRPRDNTKIPLSFKFRARVSRRYSPGWRETFTSSSLHHEGITDTATSKPVASLRIVAPREPSSDRARSRIVLETRARNLLDSSALHSTYSLSHSRIVIPRARTC